MSETAEGKRTIASTRSEFEGYLIELDTCDKLRAEWIEKEASACDQLMLYSWEGRYGDREWEELNQLVCKVAIKAKDKYLGAPL